MKSLSLGKFISLRIRIAFGFFLLSIFGPQTLTAETFKVVLGSSQFFTKSYHLVQNVPLELVNSFPGSIYNLRIIDEVSGNYLTAISELRKKQSFKLEFSTKGVYAIWFQIFNVETGFENKKILIEVEDQYFF